MTSTRTIVLLGLLLPLLGGCEQRAKTVLEGHAIRARDVAKLAIGKSTQGDVEQLFGAPDERAPDGSLIYRAAAVRHTGRAFAGWTIGDDTEVVSQRSATFRFERGVLSRICRERS